MYLLVSVCKKEVKLDNKYICQIFQILVNSKRKEPETKTKWNGCGLSTIYI